MNIPHIGNTVVRSVKEGLETEPLDQSLNVVTISSCWCVYVCASSVATLKITFHKLFLGCYIYCGRTAIQNYHIIISTCVAFLCTQRWYSTMYRLVNVR